MPSETNIISEYRRRQLRVSIAELLCVTTVAGALCALGRFGVIAACAVLVSGGLCRAIGRTRLGWILGPIVAFFAGSIGAAMHLWLAVPVALLAVIIAGQKLGKDRFYRSYPDWRRDRDSSK